MNESTRISTIFPSAREELLARGGDRLTQKIAALEQQRDTLQAEVERLRDALTHQSALRQTALGQAAKDQIEREDIARQRDAMVDALEEVLRDDQAGSVVLLASTYSKVIEALKMAGRLPR